MQNSNGSVLESDQQALARDWALAMGSILVVANYGAEAQFDKISFNNTKEYLSIMSERELREEVLDRFWEINSRFVDKAHAESIRTLNFLLFRGHRAPFLTESSVFLGKESQYLAWDMARLVSVAQMCYSAGYISEQEMWEYMAAAAFLTQSRFGSWEQFGRAYLDGRFYWNGQQDSPKFNTVVERLVQDPLSPWSKIPWTTSLAPLREFLFLPEKKTLPSELAPELAGLKPGARTYFYIESQLRELADSFGFLPLRPFAYFQRDKNPKIVRRLVFEPQEFSTEEDSVLHVKVFAGIRFGQIEEFVFKNSRLTDTAPTFAQYSKFLAEDDQSHQWSITSLADLTELKEKLANEYVSVIVPSLQKNTTIEEVLFNFPYGKINPLCRWREFHLEAVLAGAELLLGKKSEAVSRIKTAVQKWPTMEKWAQRLMEDVEKVVPLHVLDQKIQSPEVISVRRDLQSQDQAVALNAAQKVIENSDDYECWDLFSVAHVFLRSQKFKEAAFWYYLAEIRGQCLVYFASERDQEPSWLGQARYAIGEPLKKILEQDPRQLSQIIGEAVAFDQSHPESNLSMAIDDLEWEMICMQVRSGLSGLAQFYAKVDLSAWLAKLERKKAS